MNSKLLIGAGIAAAVVVGIGWFAADRLFLAEYRDVRAQIADYAQRTESFENGAKGSRDIKIGLRDAAETMLGGEQNVVEHRLRGLLSELAERNGLSEISVSHGRPRVEANPANDRASRVNRTLRRRLGDQTDFAVIRGRVQGMGTLDQVVRTLADLRAQGWIHRVEGFTIEPKGKERSAFELKADFATIFAPDLVEAEAEAPVLVAADDNDVRALGVIASRAPFRFAEPKPEMPPAPPVRVVTKPAKKPLPPYDKWRVTGVMESLGAGASEQGGVEVFLARTDTGETRTLTVGQGVLGATLTRASGEHAWFEKDGRAVVVQAGETLDRARPAETVHSEAVGSG